MSDVGCSRSVPGSIRRATARNAAPRLGLGHRRSVNPRKALWHRAYTDEYRAGHRTGRAECGRTSADRWRNAKPRCTETLKVLQTSDNCTDEFTLSRRAQVDGWSGGAWQRGRDARAVFRPGSQCWTTAPGESLGHSGSPFARAPTCAHVTSWV